VRLRRTPVFSALIAAGLALPIPASAAKTLQLSFASLQGQGWQAQGVSVEIGLRNETEFSLRVQAEQVQLAAIKPALTHISFTCPQFHYTPRQAGCAVGELQVSAPMLDKPLIPISFQYQPGAGLQAEISNATLAGGAVKANFTQANGGWQASLQSQATDLAKLWAGLARYMEMPADFSLAGKANLRLEAASGAEGISLKLQGDGKNLKYANAAGSQAGENLALQVNLDTRFAPRKTAVQGGITLQAGEIFSDPLYVKHQGKPARLDFKLAWQGAAKKLLIEQARYHHPGVIDLQASSAMTLGETFKLERLSARLSELSLARFYPLYLKTWLADRGWNQIRANGAMEASVDWNGKQGQASAVLRQLDVYSGNVGVGGLDGALHWRSGGTVDASRLRWTTARLGPNLTLEQGEIQAALRDAEFSLLQALHIPLLDGAIEIEQLRVSEILKQPQVEFSGKIEPISMAAISRAMDWPELGGEISAVIPAIRYADSQLNLDGAVLVSLFGGNILVHRMGLRLGATPELAADVEVSNLDLATLTRFLKFGDISGRLSGRVSDLRMLNWQPVSFDAYFATPADDTSPHKINQKAVQNLSSLGGASVADALSRSVLRVFENFSYDRIGWGCRLHNGRCEMRGAEPAPNGYYIVKGGGLPRIDVIGYNQRVDWNELLNRVKRVTHIGAPVIE
jgi:hypothetical protein